MKDPGWRRGVLASLSCALSRVRLRGRGDSAGASRSARASCCALPSLGPEQHSANLEAMNEAAAASVEIIGSSCTEHKKILQRRGSCNIEVWSLNASNHAA